MPERNPELVALARAALQEITPEKTIGEPDAVVEDGEVTTVTFSNRMDGYPGWQWTVSIARLPGQEPTVLEAELMPGTGSLLSPDWVPWSERLAEYQAAQEAARASDESEAGSGAGSPAGDDDSDSDSDDDDDDLLGSDVLHGGDLDGVDIDEDGVDAEPDDSDSDEFDSDDSEFDSDDDDSDDDEHERTV